MKKVSLIAALLALLMILASCSDSNAFRVGEAICKVNGKGYVSLQSAVDAITGTSSRGFDDTVYTIELLREVNDDILDENRGGVVIPPTCNGTIVIDFKGYHYNQVTSATECFKVSGGNLILKNGTVCNINTENAFVDVDGANVSAVNMYFGGWSTKAAILKNGAKLNIEGDNEFDSRIEGKFFLDKTSTLTFDGGSNYIKGITDIDEDETGNIILKSGKINVVHEEESRVKDIYNSLSESERININIDIIHDLSMIDYKNATCTEDGNITYWKCDTCSKLFRDSFTNSEITSADTVIHALGHDVVHYEAKDASCEEKGNKEYYRCKRCYVYSTSADLSDTLTYNEVFCFAALGHALPEEWAIEKEPTCSETGLKTKKCSRCSYVESEYIPTVSHNLSGWKTDDDYHWKECSMCHNNVDYESHDFTEWVQDSEHGVQTKECKRCGKKVTEEYHDLEEVSAKAATCTEDGNIKYYKCTVHENEFYSDSSMTTKLSSSEIVINKLGHIESSEYTIDEKKHSKLCIRCNTVLESEDHDWVCHTDELNPEFHTSTCTVCGRMDFVKEFDFDDNFHWEKCGANDDWESTKKNIHHYVDGKCVICGREKTK